MEYTVKQREKKGKEREEAAGDHDIFKSLLQLSLIHIDTAVICRHRIISEQDILSVKI